MSSNWYKCVAIIKYQRPRKGFSVKYKGDTKWSRALYKCLDKLQIDGSQILPNRDDQAGFCLDSTFPHKNMPSLNVHSSNLTTHTQIFSTNTKNSYKRQATTLLRPQLPVKFVKAAGVHQMNPTKYTVNMEILQTIKSYYPLF